MWEKQHIELKKNGQLIKELGNRNELLFIENEELIKSLNSLRKEMGGEVDKLKKQLYGAIRRIHYLL